VNLQSRVLLEKGADELGAVGLTIVPEHHDRPPTNVALKVPEERDYLRAPNGTLADLEVEAAPRSDPPIAETLGQRPWWINTGVSPTGAHVFALYGMIERALSSTNTITARRWRAFC
jgi:hypothetical protein